MMNSGAFVVPDLRNKGGPSRYFDARAIRTLNRLGDIFCPAVDDLPSFSAIGCAAHVDRLLSQMPASDRKDLIFLFSVLGYFPQPLLALFIRFLAFSPRMPTFGFGILRFMNLGLKGLAVSLYYSGFTGPDYAGLSPPEILGFQMRVYVGDMKSPD